MTTKTERIRKLNDRLRQNFAEGQAVMTGGVAALGPEAVARIVKTSPFTMTSVTPTIPTKSMTSDHSTPTAKRYFLRSIITTAP
jgi:hypothetical protein